MRVSRAGYQMMPDGRSVRAIVFARRMRVAKLALSVVACVAIFVAPYQLANSQEMSFELRGNGGNCIGCGWIQASGEISETSPRRFEEAVKTGGNFVALDSSGGDVLAALKLGYLFRQHGVFVTIAASQRESQNSHASWRQVPGLCASACVYAALGAISRTVPDGSRVGVHQVFDAREMRTELGTGKGDVSRTQALVGLLAAYVNQMGADGSLVFLASSTGPTGIHWLSRGELVKSKFVTSDEAIGEWRILPDGRRLRATSVYVLAGKPPVLVTLRCHGQRPNLAEVELSTTNAFLNDELPRLVASGYRFEMSVGERRIPAYLSRMAKGLVVATGAVEISTLLSMLSKPDKLFLGVEFPRVYGFPLHATAVGRDGLSFVDAVLRRC